MRTAVFAALLGMAAPAALLAQTSTPPTDPAATGAMPTGAGATGGMTGGTTGAGATAATGGAGTGAAGSTGTAGTGAAATAASPSADGAAAPSGGAAGSQNPMVMPHSEGAPAPATAPAEPAAGPATTPQDFVNQAASSGMFEVQSSELALERSSTPEVQDFARLMIRDHGELNEQLKALAASQNLTVPAEISGPPAQHMQAILQAEGDSFDQVYLDHQAQAHAEAIALFEPWAEQTDDANIAAMAQKVIQHVRTHQETVEKIRGN